MEEKEEDEKERAIAMFLLNMVLLCESTCICCHYYSDSCLLNPLKIRGILNVRLLCQTHEDCSRTGLMNVV